MGSRHLLFVAALLASVSAAAADAPRFDCSCRYQGQSYRLGSFVCIRTPSGDRLARCEMVLNNTSWTFLSEGCPTATAEPPPDPAGDRRPG